MVVQISGWVGVIAASLAIITLLVTLFAFTRASYAKADNERLMQSNKILSDRADVFDEEIKRVRQEKKDSDAAYEVRLVELRTGLSAEVEKVRVLQGIVTGKAELKELKDTIIKHDLAVQERHKDLIKHIDDFLVKLTPESKS